MWSRNRQGVTVSDCLCMCVFLLLPPSLSEAELKKKKKKGTQIKAVYFLLREEKGRMSGITPSSSLCCPPPPPPSPPSWMPGSWMAQRGRRRRVKGGGWVAQLCFVWTPSASGPWARLGRSPGVCFGFHARPPMPGFRQMWRQLGPNSVYVLGHRRDYK